MDVCRDVNYEMLPKYSMKFRYFVFNLFPLPSILQFISITVNPRTPLTRICYFRLLFLSVFEGRHFITYLFGINYLYGKSLSMESVYVFVNA